MLTCHILYITAIREAYREHLEDFLSGPGDVVTQQGIRKLCLCSGFVHLQWGWTCQINTRGYFCNIQKVSAAHQSARAPYFRWQQLLDLSWTIQSLALFGMYFSIKKISCGAFSWRGSFPFEIIRDIFILCFKCSSKFTVHISKVRGSHGMLGSTLSLNIWICAILQLSWGLVPGSAKSSSVGLVFHVLC